MAKLLIALASFFCLCPEVLADEPAYVWEEVTLNAPFKARDGGGAIVFDGKMWLLGGWNPSIVRHEICALAVGIDISAILA